MTASALAKRKSKARGRNTLWKVHVEPKHPTEGANLRLRFIHPATRKRTSFSLERKDTPRNRILAENKALAMERDYDAGKFDDSLNSYKPKRYRGKVISGVTAGKLFTMYRDMKADEGLSRGRLDCYLGALRHLERQIGEVDIESVDTKVAEDFTKYLNGQVSDVSVKEYLMLNRACWNWAKEQGYLSFDINPWEGVLKAHKVKPKQKVQPFSKDEVKRIKEAFYTEKISQLRKSTGKVYQVDNPYRHYADFVSFLFGTGCRPGEAIALKWKHINGDCESVWFGESVSRGHRKDTKTGKARTVVLSDSITAMLKARRPDNADSEALIFPAPKGREINDKDFNQRAWRKTLGRIGIDLDKSSDDKRTPYSTRHTAISHALADGANPVEVSDATGHDLKTLFEHYAHVIKRRSVMSEF